MKKRFIIIVFLFSFSYTNAQQDSIAIADNLVYNENFNTAINFYKEIANLDPKNPIHQYKLGFCYLNTPEKRDSSIVPFKKFFVLYDKLSKRNKRKVSIDILEVKFYLARAYRVNMYYDSALTLLNEIDTRNKKFLKIIEAEKKLCEDGRLLTNNPINIKIENLGNLINSKYTEHTPVFTADESELIFTSRKRLFPNVPIGFDNEYDENLYFSIKDSLGNWQKAKPMESLNTESHEATISLSFDGSKLFIYKAEDNGSIYYSEYYRGRWLSAKKLGENINTKHRETHASLSFDGSILFFTSDRPGGYGGLDIYMSKKLPDGTWGKASNIGGSINSEKDEESPYILPDGKTLYFSSKGHGGMGGFDIFSTTMTQFGTWLIPQNIGYPINSVDDDVYFFPTPDEKRAYFTSKKGSGFGKTDIYLMKLPEGESSNIVVMVGKLSVCDGDIPFADILITDNTAGNYYTVVQKNNKFIFVTQKEHEYTISIEVEHKIVFSDTLTVDADAPSIQIYKVVRLDPDVPCSKIVTITDEDLIDPQRIGPDGAVFDNFVQINNILFPLNKVGIIKRNSTLDTLSNYLIRNPTAQIEVGGYCDASGSANYNYILSIKRAEAVKKYMIDVGVEPEQVIVVGYGEENPIAINRNNDNTWNRDGLQLNRRVEFRLKKQGDETLLIWGMKINDRLRNPNYKYNYQKADVNNIEILY